MIIRRSCSRMPHWRLCLEDWDRDPFRECCTCSRGTSSSALPSTMRTRPLCGKRCIYRCWTILVRCSGTPCAWGGSQGECLRYWGCGWERVDRWGGGSMVMGYVWGYSGDLHYSAFLRRGYSPWSMAWGALWTWFFQHRKYPSSIALNYSPIERRALICPWSSIIIDVAWLVLQWIVWWYEEWYLNCLLVMLGGY